MSFSRSLFVYGKNADILFLRFSGRAVKLQPSKQLLWRWVHSSLVIFVFLSSPWKISQLFQMWRLLNSLYMSQCENAIHTRGATCESWKIRAAQCGLVASAAVSSLGDLPLVIEGIIGF